MPGLHIDLFKLARDIAAEQAEKAEALYQEIRQIEADLPNKKAQLNVVREASSRLDTYVPEIDGTRQCPFCWVADEVHSNLSPIPSNRREDRFRCGTCAAEITLSH